MIKLLMVFLGGGLGSLIRFLFVLLEGRYLKYSFPIAILGVNIAGSFLLGFLFCFLLNKTTFSEELKLFLTVGFCGGLTTFSTYIIDIIKLVQNGEITKSIIYMVFSIILSLIAAICGIFIAKAFS